MRSWRLTLATMSLTARVSLAVASLLLLGGLFVSLAAFGYGRTAAREAYDRLLLGAANDIAASIFVLDGHAVVDLPISAFELLALAPDDRIAYRVIGVDGRTLTGYEDLAAPGKASKGDVQFYDADFLGEPARYAAVSRRFAERELNGTVEIIVGQTLMARNALALDITRNALAVLVISGSIMLLLAGLVVRSALKPLDRIGEMFSRRDPHDLTPMDPAVPREAAVLISALNGFMARLDRQMGSMRNLISDTAHQLRTPVAALRAQADLAAEEEDEARRKMIVDTIHQRSVSLGRLLDQMLSRALVMHRSDSVRREIIDLRDVALEVMEDEDHRLLAPGREVHLVIDDDPVLVLADGPSLAEAVKNLLQNALKHGTGVVHIGASRQEGSSRIWVQDEGKGPPEEVRNALGQRFTRTAASKGNSAGLGLSIAKSVAEAFDGQLQLGPDGERGFRAEIVLPRAGGEG
jgi:two-component system, OmpR family, sensor histidine kinase TctE